MKKKTYIVPSHWITSEPEYIFCITCGSSLIVEKTIKSYSPYTGQPITKTEYHCPNWLKRDWGIHKVTLGDM